jgi:transcriptional regulator with XRE-family HTH domain
MADNIGERIEKLAKEKRIPASEIADKLDITVQNLYKMFKKDSIKTIYIFRLSEIFDVSVDFLLFGEELSDRHSSKLNKLQSENEKLKKRIAELEEQLADKNQVLDFVRQESLLTYANLITALAQNRMNKDGGIDPDQLDLLTRTKVFDADFLQKLLDMEFITETDYLFFVQQAKEKK